MGHFAAEAPKAGQVIPFRLKFREMTHRSAGPPGIPKTHRGLLLKIHSILGDTSCTQDPPLGLAFPKATLRLKLHNSTKFSYVFNVMYRNIMHLYYIN